METSIAFLKNGLQEGQSMLAAFTNNRQKSKMNEGVLPSDKQHDNLLSVEEYEEDSEERFDDEEEEVEIKDEEIFEL